MNPSSNSFSWPRRLAITGCLLLGCVFSLRAMTPDVAATGNRVESSAPEISPSAAALSTPVQASVQSTVKLVTRNIEDIKEGDLVLARDEHGSQISFKPVKETYRRISHHLRHLTFECSDGTQQTLSTTDEHPFWSATADDFVDAGSLIVGHTMTGPDGESQTLVSSTREEFPNGTPVFNFQVTDFHTYFVAASADKPVMLVHNADYAVPAYVGSAAHPIPVGVPTKNVDELISRVDGIPQSLKGTISQSEQGARELAEGFAEKMGLSKLLSPIEVHGNGMKHFHIDAFRDLHFWF